jgi:hypothetical protein
MKWRMACLIVTGTVLGTACQRERSTVGDPAPFGDTNAQPRATDYVLSVSSPIEVAPYPRLAYRYTEFMGQIIEIGKDSISVQGFELLISTTRAEFNRQKGTSTWTGWPLGTPFALYFGTLGPKHDIKGKVRPGNRGVDSGPGCDFIAITAVWSREVITITHPDGTVTVLRRADEPPRKFAVEWSYSVGVVPDDLSTPNTYRLSDLRVGDEVCLRFRHDLGNGAPNIVHGIMIERRPGGTIPPAPGERTDAVYKHHEVMQAYQDCAEKGTPIPWKFLSPDEQAERLAPPPREAGLPRIAPAKD